MAKFLTTTGTNYHLEELIKGASDRLVLISPFLKLNDRKKHQGIGGKASGSGLAFSPQAGNLPRWQDLFALNSQARSIT